MRLRRLAVLGLLLGLAGGAEAQTFTPTDLGAHIPGGVSTGTGINNAGQIVGSAADSTGQYKAFLWSRSEGMKKLDMKGYLYTEGHGINAHGDVVGRGRKDAAYSPPQSLMWLGGGAGQTLVVVKGSMQSEAYAINDSRQIVGMMVLSDGKHAFLSSVVGGKRKAFDLGFGEAIAINNSGQVLIRLNEGRSSGTDFYLWTPDQPNGVTGSRVYIGSHRGPQAALNDKGQVVIGRHLWVPAYDPETGLTPGVHDLGYLQEPTAPEDAVLAHDLNEQGQVVGVQLIVSTRRPDGTVESYVARPFIWDPVLGMKEVQLDETEPGWVLSVPSTTRMLALSDRPTGAAYGRIATSGHNPDGVRRAVLLEPVPTTSGN